MGLRTHFTSAEAANRQPSASASACATPTTSFAHQPSRVLSATLAGYWDSTWCVKDERGVMGFQDAEICKLLLNKTTDVQLMLFTALGVIGRFPSVLRAAYNAMYDGDSLPAYERFLLQQAAATAYLEWCQSLHRDSPVLQGLDPDLREAIPRVFSTDLSMRPSAEELLDLPCFKNHLPVVTGIVDQQRPEHLQEQEAIRANLRQHLTPDSRPDVAHQRYEAALRHQADLERQRAEY